MRGKVQPAAPLRRLLLLGGVVLLAPLAAAGGREGDVAGRVTMLDRDDRPGDDVGQAVVWLDGAAARPPAPTQAEVGTSDKEFSPHVLVVPAGSTVGFPNHDPFNHNVFSLSEENPFDLGLYGRGETRSVTLARPGIVRVYCNVHAQMSAVIVVRDGPHYAQPSSDGSFVLRGVPPGRYRLHAWHERAADVARDLEVPPGGLADLTIELDARGYEFKPHLNKHGQPYPQQGRRY